MQYLLMIYNEENGWDAMPEDVRGQMMTQFGAFTQSIQQSGNYKSGNRLFPSTKATSLRVRDGKKLITDGPFAETKEQLGGYYIIEAADLDEATAIAFRIPAVVSGTIEVRPIVPV